MIYRADDALVSIGYCGDAYVDGIPTDNWIAATLTGINVNPMKSPLPWQPADAPPGPLIAEGPIPRRMKLGQALIHLANEMTKRSIGRTTSVAVAGWQWSTSRASRPRPVLIRVGWDAVTSSFQPSFRDFERDPGEAIVQIAAIGRATADTASWVDGLANSELERYPFTLASFIRDEAALPNSGVGADTLFVTLGQPTLRRFPTFNRSHPSYGHDRFFGVIPGYAPLPERTGLPGAGLSGATRFLPAHGPASEWYSPWFLSSYLCVPPMTITGITTIAMGVDRIAIAGPAGDPWQSQIQTRTHPPGVRRDYTQRATQAGSRAAG